MVMLSNVWLEAIELPVVTAAAQTNNSLLSSDPVDFAHLLLAYINYLPVCLDGSSVQHDCLALLSTTNCLYGKIIWLTRATSSLHHHRIHDATTHLQVGLLINGLPVTQSCTSYWLQPSTPEHF